MTAEATVDSIISKAQTAATTAQTKAQGYTDTAVSLASARNSFNITSGIDAPATPLPLTPPTINLGDLLDGEKDSERIAVQTFIDTKFKEFLDDYFPQFAGKLASLAAWLDDAIVNGGTGLNASVEGQIWDRARTREDAVNNANLDEAVTAVASRGWSLPSGALAERARIANQENANRVSGLSRDIAIKQAELEQSNVRFAVSQAASLYVSMVGVATNFVTLLIRSYSIGLADSQALTQATEAFYNQSILYFRALLQQEQLDLQYETANYDATYKLGAHNSEQATAQTRTQAEAAVGAAKVMGSIGSSALSSLNTMATVAHETTKEE